MSRNRITITTLCLALSCVAPSLAAEDNPSWIMDTSGVGQDNHGVVRSDQLLELGVPSAGGLQLEGENSMLSGDLDRALISLQKSVEMAPEDMDKRSLYAQTLEKKLMQQKKKKDPKLYNFVVKQWMFVYKKAEFVDQTMEAKSHLMQLCGTAPRPLEKPEKFFARVLLPEDGSDPKELTENKKNAKTE